MWSHDYFEREIHFSVGAGWIFRGLLAIHVIWLNILNVVREEGFYCTGGQMLRCTRLFFTDGKLNGQRYFMVNNKCTKFKTFSHFFFLFAYPLLHLHDFISSSTAGSNKEVLFKRD